MTGHRKTRMMMYDYLQHQLDGSARQMIERHLAACPACTKELAALRLTLASMQKPAYDPSGSLDAEFWKSFASRVEERIRIEVKPGVRPGFTWLDTIRSRYLFRPHVAYACAGVALLCIAAIAVWRIQSPSHSIVEQLPVARPAVDTTAEEMSRYIRRSKALLVGLENLTIDEEQPTDIDVERSVSRQLLNASRDLRRQRLDPRTEDLLSNLDRVFKVVANSKHGAPEPYVGLAREGIRRENLLFKVRMAENRLGSARFMTASHSE